MDCICTRNCVRKSQTAPRKEGNPTNVQHEAHGGRPRAGGSSFGISMSELRKVQKRITKHSEGNALVSALESEIEKLNERIDRLLEEEKEGVEASVLCDDAECKTIIQNLLEMLQKISGAAEIGDRDSDRLHTVSESLLKISGKFQSVWKGKGILKEEKIIPKQILDAVKELEAIQQNLELRQKNN